MNKAELINSMAKEAGIPREAAEKALESLLNNVEEVLKKGGRVSLQKFGTWTIKIRPARQGRNPQTGKRIKISSKAIVTFRPSSNLLNDDDTGPLKNE